MTDWKAVAVALAFVYAMARVEKVNHHAMKLSVLFVLALAGYKTIPLIAPMLLPAPSQSAALVDAATTQEPSMNDSPHSPAKLAELRDARADLVESIERLEAQIADLRAQPTRPDDAPYDRNTSAESSIANGIAELEGQIEQDMHRIAEIDAELAWTGAAP